MKYFSAYDLVEYQFGQEADVSVFRNIAVYAELVDKIKNDIAFYIDYNILEFERPDQVSYKLYNTPIYHWTLFLMNDNLRECGWPMSNRDVLKHAQKLHPNTSLRFKAYLAEVFKVGQTLNGSTSGATGVVDHRHLDVGQLVINNVTGTFQVGEIVTSVNSSGVIESLQLESTSPEYLSAKYYLNGNEERVDIADLEIGPTAQQTEITYLDDYTTENENLKQIRVIKPDIIQNVARAFKEAVTL